VRCLFLFRFPNILKILVLNLEAGKTVSECFKGLELDFAKIPGENKIPQFAETSQILYKSIVSKLEAIGKRILQKPFGEFPKNCFKIIKQGNFPKLGFLNLT
jgi:hypothetical protein